VCVCVCVQNAVFCLERICDIVEVNESRLEVVWPIVRNHFEYVLVHAAPKPTFYIERIVVSLFRLSMRLFVKV